LRAFISPPVDGVALLLGVAGVLLRRPPVDAADAHRRLGVALSVVSIHPGDALEVRKVAVSL